MSGDSVIVVRARALGGRTIRCYSRAETGDIDWEGLVESDSDEADPSRAQRLEVVLGAPAVWAVAHETSVGPDVRRVYLLVGDQRLFACVLVSLARVARMLDEAAIVVEGQWLQVVSSETPTDAAVIAGLDAWAERNFRMVMSPARLKLLRPYMLPNGG